MANHAPAQGEAFEGRGGLVAAVPSVGELQTVADHRGLGHCSRATRDPFLYLSRES